MTVKKIEDFGEKIGGAKKDRIKEFLNMLNDSSDISVRPFSKIWPDPDWEKLVQEMELWKISYARALRDSVPRKPSAIDSYEKYLEKVNSVKQFAFSILSGKYEYENFIERIKSVKEREPLYLKAELYTLMGHSFSLDGLNAKTSNIIENGRTTRTIIIQGKQRGGLSLCIMGKSLEELAEKLKKTVPEKSKTKKKEKNVELSLKETMEKVSKLFGIYSLRGQPGYSIGRKHRGGFLKLFVFDTLEAARLFFKEKPTLILETYEKSKQTPSERNDVNTERIGEKKYENATPEFFMETTKVRGAEFGNWVEQSIRSEILSNTLESFSDLAEVLNCGISDLFFEGDLALAFGARGYGGKNAPSAHYEPDKRVINLTKKNGPGSIAHEWFHALDGFIFSEIGGDKKSSEPLATIHSKVEKKWNTDKSTSTMSFLKKSIIKILRETKILERSVDMDMIRSSSGEPYFQKTEEIMARCFEYWVMSKLEEKNVRNDWLVNIKSYENFNKESFKGLPETKETYPYPLQEEKEIIVNVFDELMPFIIENMICMKKINEKQESDMDSADSSFSR